MHLAAHLVHCMAIRCRELAQNSVPLAVTPHPRTLTCSYKSPNTWRKARRTVSLARSCVPVSHSRRAGAVPSRGKDSTRAAEARARCPAVPTRLTACKPRRLPTPEYLRWEGANPIGRHDAARTTHPSAPRECLGTFPDNVLAGFGPVGADGARLQCQRGGR